MNNQKKSLKIIQLIINLFTIIVLIGFDQLTKQLAVMHLKDQNPFSIISGVLELQYLENRGAAFGMLQNRKLLFVFIAIVMLTIICYVLVKLPMQKKFIIWQIFLSFIAAGGIGNMIDRITQDYVTDFIYIILIDFPIFNVADIFVTLGTVLLFVDILFFKKESDLSFLKWELQKND